MKKTFDLMIIFPHKSLEICNYYQARLFMKRA